MDSTDGLLDSGVDSDVASQGAGISLKNDLKKMKSALQSQSEEIKKLKLQLQSSLNVTLVQEHNDKLEKELDEARQDATHYKQQSDSNRQIIEMLQKEIEVIQQKSANRSSIEDTTRKLESKIVEIKELEVKISKQRKEIQERDLEITHKTAEIRKLHKDITVLSHNVKDLTLRENSERVRTSSVLTQY